MFRAIKYVQLKHQQDNINLNAGWDMNVYIETLQNTVVLLRLTIRANSVCVKKASKKTYEYLNGNH